MYSSSKTKAALIETEALNFVYLKLCVSVIHDSAASSDLHKGVFSVMQFSASYQKHFFPSFALAIARDVFPLGAKRNYSEVIFPVYQCEDKDQVSLTIFEFLSYSEQKEKLLSVYTNMQMTRGASILFQTHHKYKMSRYSILIKVFQQFFTSRA